MGKFKRWWIKCRLIAFFKREYPVPHTYTATLMYLSLQYLSSIEDAAVIEIFNELLEKGYLRVHNNDYSWAEYIYVPNKERKRRVTDGKI